MIVRLANARCVDIRARITRVGHLDIALFVIMSVSTKMQLVTQLSVKMANAQCAGKAIMIHHSLMRYQSNSPNSPRRPTPGRPFPSLFSPRIPLTCTQKCGTMRDSKQKGSMGMAVKEKALRRLADKLNAAGVQWAIGGDWLLCQRGEKAAWHEFEIFVTPGEQEKADKVLTKLGMRNEEADAVAFHFDGADIHLKTLDTVESDGDTQVLGATVHLLKV